MDAVRVILYNIIAVLCYSTAPVSLQQYCKDYNTDDPQCGTSIVDGLDLTMDCINSTTANITWKNKTTVQLVSLEYVCFDQSTQNFTIFTIKKGTGESKGYRMVTDDEVSVYQCTLFGCIYIEGKNCWQLNEGNATCANSYSPVSQNIGTTSVVVPISQTHSIWSQLHVYSAYTTPVHTYTEVLSSSVYSLSSIGYETNVPSLPSSERIYEIVIIVSIFMGVLFGILLIMLLAFCLICSKRNQTKLETNFDNDLKTSNSFYMFNTLPGSESIVTNINSLEHFPDDTKPSNLNKCDMLNTTPHEKLDKRTRSTRSAEPSHLHSVSSCLSTSLSLTPSDKDPSYCKMSKLSFDSDIVSKSDTHSSNDSVYSTAAADTLALPCDLDLLVSLKMQMNGKGSHIVSGDVQLSHETDSTPNSSKLFVSESDEFRGRNIRHCFNPRESEIDFCDIDMNTESKSVEN